jgi:hypothetical protein
MKSFWILIVVVMIVAVLFVELAGIPGVSARRRGHPQAKAIGLLGWIGLPMGVAPWLVALLWSNMNPLALTRDLDANDQSGATSDDDNQTSEKSDDDKKIAK